MVKNKSISKVKQKNIEIYVHEKYGINVKIRGTKNMWAQDKVHISNNAKENPVAPLPKHLQNNQI